MAESCILFVKPKAISAKDKKALHAAGVVVIEIEDPTAVKFIRAGAELSGGDLLLAAAKAIPASDYAISAFGKAICAAIEATANKERGAGDAD